MISSAIYLLMSSSLTIMSFGQKGSAKTTNEQINSFNDTRSKCKPILYRQKNWIQKYQSDSGRLVIHGILI